MSFAALFQILFRKSFHHLSVKSNHLFQESPKKDLYTREMQVLAPPAHPLIKKELHMIKPFLELSYKKIE